MRAIALWVFIVLFYSNLFSQGTIKGKVIDKSTGEALPAADVHLVELKRGTITKADGTFIIDKVPAGSYIIEVSYVGYKRTSKKIEVKSNELLNIDVELESLAIPLHEVLVTGTMYKRSLFEVYQPIAVLDEDKLGLRLSDNIASTLSYEPGINLGYYNGSAPGRPVVRGLSGARILILDNGAMIGDASDLAPEHHAISFDPASVERIEVIRGPASLFYGINSLGGAINIITEDIPRVIHDKLRGSLRLIGSTVNSSFSSSSVLNYGTKNLGFRGEFTYRKNGNTRTPIGVLNNTETENLSSSVGVAYHVKNFSTGFAFRNFSGTYGIPTEEYEEHKPKMKISRDRLVFKTDVGFEDSKIKGIELQVTGTNYDNRELEEGEVGFHLKIRTVTGDLKLKHDGIGGLAGMIGSNFIYQNYNTAGEDKFYADASLWLGSLALYEEFEMERLKFQAGLRYDFARVKSKEFEEVESRARNFNVFSSSVGLVYKIADPVNLSFNLARGFRIPTLQELFAYGPHHGSMSFEIGNPDLNVEVSNEVDLSLRLLTARASSDISVFLNYINDFIYAYNTGEVDSISGFPKYKFASANTILRGFETKFEIEALKNINLSLIVDYVEGKRRDRDEYLPLIPPLRAILGVEYKKSRYNFGVEVKLVSEQNKVAPGEERTPGYGIVNLHFGLRLPLSGLAHELNLNIENLFNKTYYDHLSRIKTFAPMPGRNISVVYHLFF